MSAITTKAKDQEGNEVLLANTQAISMVGKDFTIADDGVQTYFIAKETGTVVVSTGDDSAVFNIHVAADTSVIAKAFGSADITVTEDNDTTLNVYFDSGVFTIQNLTGGELEVNVKANI